MLFNKEENIEWWREYTEEEGQEQDHDLEKEEEVQVQDIGPPITKEEFDKALNELKGGTALRKYT